MSARDAALWAVGLPDKHLGGGEDSLALAVGLAAVRALRPELYAVVDQGDTIDCASWSTHPRRFRAEDVAAHSQEIAALEGYLVDLKAAAGRRAKLAWTEGNHEARIERTLVSMGHPDLVDALSPARVFRRHGFTVAPYAATPQEFVLWRTASGRRSIWCHGAFEGANATRNHARAPCWRGDLVHHGHTHRAAHHVEIDRGVRLEAVSAGCLASLVPIWCAPRPTGWDHGIIVERLSEARIDAWVCPIVRGCVVLPDGREVRA